MNEKPLASSATIERDMVINGTHIHIKSVFSGNIPLEKALANIAKRKLKTSDGDNKTK